MSDYLQPHRLQHVRLPCPSPSPRVCSNSCALSQWYSLTISASAALFFCFQSFPASGLFPMSRLFALGGQNVGAPPSASILLVNIQGWFPSFRVDWFDLLDVRGTLKSLLHNSKLSVLWHSNFFMIQFSHLYMITGKTITLTIQTSVSRVMSLLFHMLSRFLIVSLPGSKSPLISWLQSPSAWFWSPRK